MSSNEKKNLWSRRQVLRGIGAVGAAGAVLPHLLRAQGPVALASASDNDLLSWVNLRLGTGGHGHTYPGASVPFGMVQLSPDTSRTEDGWDWCSGYHLSQKTLLGFSHTHLSGTGCGDLLDFLVVPRTGEVKLEPGDKTKPGSGYGQLFQHENEQMHPGYYSVKLDDSGIRAELTATEHVGFHRYTFPASETSHILIDLNHSYYWDVKKGTSVDWSEAARIDDHSISVAHQTSAWGGGRLMFGYMEFSRPFDSLEFFIDGKPVTAEKAKGQSVKVVAHFKTTAGEKILLRSGISGVSVEGAKKNLQAEVTNWSFEKCCEKAEAQWREQLSKIKVETANRDHKTVFYTSLYHSMLGPTLFDDVDGQYRGMDGAVHQLASGQRNYTTFSLWDTFRAEHPLFTLIHADRVPDMVNSLIRMSTESKDGMAVWPLQGKETGCMTGYHSASVIAEAMTKGFTGIDYPAALKAMKKRAFEDNYRGIQFHRTKGYIPADVEEESVSKSLEYCYDDWAIAHVAEKLGDKETAAKLIERSRNYRNYWDPQTKFLRAKLQDGTWALPFDPLEVGHDKKYRDYTESNAWQTAFGVQHDVTSYIQLVGGDKAFTSRMDELFNNTSPMPADAPPDIAGLIGQYAHGNEPSHHIAYLYAYTGEQAKAAERIHQINTTLYLNAPDGIAGNEDCGQMSAWFLLSSMGFYSVDPVSTHYIFGSPLFNKVTMKLAGGRELVIESPRATEKSLYIERVEFNGKAHPQAWFSHADVAKGGRFKIQMSDKPSATFGRSLKDRPVS